MCLLPGALAFIAFCFFDINKIKWQSKKLNLLFAAGVLLLLLSTVLCITRDNDSMMKVGLGRLQILYLICLLSTGAALLYTLFFALPFQKTYGNTGSLPLVSRGVYALCRHPGFWLFALFYMFLWLFFGNPWLFAAFLLYTMCNFAYVSIQDRFIFPQYIIGYEDYKASVPFLIPNKESIRKFLSKK